MRYHAGSKTATLDPSSDLAAGVTYTAILTTGAKDRAGNALAQVQWSFTTAAGTISAQAAPSNLKARAGRRGELKVTLTWKDKSSNEDGFRIEQTTDNWTIKTSVLVGRNTISSVDTAVVGGTR